MLVARPSEHEARVQWQLSGVPLAQPVIDGVEAGIEQVIGLFKTRRLQIFETMHRLRSELNSYARELDDAGEATEKIADKQKHHRADALRYGCSAFPMYRACSPAEGPEANRSAGGCGGG